MKTYFKQLLSQDRLMGYTTNHSYSYKNINNSGYHFYILLKRLMNVTCKFNICKSHTIKINFLLIKLDICFCVKGMVVLHS